MTWESQIKISLENKLKERFFQKKIYFDTLHPPKFETDSRSIDLVLRYIIITFFFLLFKDNTCESISIIVLYFIIIVINVREVL